MSEPRTETTDEVTQPIPEKHHSNSHGFRVEVRCRVSGCVLGDTLIGSDWVRLPTIRETQQSIGIDRRGMMRTGAPASSDSIYDALTDTHSYMGAIALAASTLSQGPLGLEARLIEYRREIEYKVTQTDILAFPDTIDTMCAFAEARRDKEKKS